MQRGLPVLAWSARCFTCPRTCSGRAVDSGPRRRISPGCGGGASSPSCGRANSRSPGRRGSGARREQAARGARPGQRAAPWSGPLLTRPGARARRPVARMLEDPASAVRAFGGGHRFMAEYLSSVVLAAARRRCSTYGASASAKPSSAREIDQRSHMPHAACAACAARARPSLMRVTPPSTLENFMPEAGRPPPSRHGPPLTVARP